MAVYHRNNCRLCGSENVSLEVKLKPIPLAEAYCDSAKKGREIPRYPVDLYFCHNCGHVQQLDVVDSDSLWSKYTYFSGAAAGIKEHFAQIAKSVIADYAVQSGSFIVDIGSNDGSLLMPFKEAGMSVLGVDPADAPAARALENGIPTIVEPMTLPLAKKIVTERGKAKVVLMFNAFAHMDNLGEIADCVETLLDKDGVFIFECQYLDDILEKRLVATIFHEHMSHHSLTALAPFFKKHGMEIIDVRRAPIQHGSIVGTAQHLNGPWSVKPVVGEMLAMEHEKGQDSPEALRAFAADMEDMRARVSDWVKRVKADGSVIAGYGAARSGPTLISQLGLENALDYVMDDHPQKIGKFTSGDGLPVLPTATLYEKMPPFTVILAWVHADKIIREHQKYLDQGGAFLVLCPWPQLVGKIDGIVKL